MPARTCPWEAPFASIGSLKKGDVVQVVSDGKMAREALSFVKKPPKDRGLKFFFFCFVVGVRHLFMTLHARS